jgi:Domain of Unknown Function (DUF1080)
VVRGLWPVVCGRHIKEPIMPFFFLRHVALALVAASAPLCAAEPAISLFDGTTLNGWEGADGLWRIEDGAITGETTKGKKLKENSFLIWRVGKVADFTIEFHYRILSDSANSGLQYRSKELGNFVVSGYQADIEAGVKYSGINYGEKTGRNILAERGQRVTYTDGQEKSVEQFAPGADLQKFIHGKGEWNLYKIVAHGATLSHFINGTLMSETIDKSKEAAHEGILALQLHVGPPMKIQFKDIMLTPIK